MMNLLIIVMFCCCCCEIPDHRVVPTIGTTLVSLILDVVSILYGDCIMCFLTWAPAGGSKGERSLPPRKS